MAYLEITLKVAEGNRVAAAGVYQKYKQPFLDTVPGARSKELLVRDEDVQVLHGFSAVSEASTAPCSSRTSSAVWHPCSPPIPRSGSTTPSDDPGRAAALWPQLPSA